MALANQLRLGDGPLAQQRNWKVNQESKAEALWWNWIVSAEEKAEEHGPGLLCYTWGNLSVPDPISRRA